MEGREELEQIVESSEIEAATNRVLKLVRYCGFYKVEEDFLRAFCQQIANSSIKELIPIIKRGDGFTQNLLTEAQMSLEAAQRQIHNPNRCCNLLQLTLEFLGEALVCSFGFLPRTGSRMCFCQFVQRISDGQGIVKLQGTDGDTILANPAAHLYAQVEARLLNVGVPIRRFISFARKVYKQVFEIPTLHCSGLHP